ncbi:MMPL family transporter [Paracrocinitomix mangrovi]|uniref:efflux RND transporter permease subunit n=1 Tax=Paracrocinitomix mangrovi TaxID=2862509 RepID=UPI001C8DB71B|nr:MMPL family transporter [Paracrocinitomix mangrovi]UKN03097.1 MMPL family transporter [Paracrocinitomix mangrovi]
MGRLKNIATITLIAVILLSVLFGIKIANVRFDFDFEAFFSKSDPETTFYEEHRSRFETDNDFIFVALINEPSIFDKEFLTKARDFVDELAEDTMVVSVQCVTHMEEYVKTPFSAAVMSRPYVHIDNPEKYEKDSARIYSHPEIANTFVDKDGTAILINIRHQENLSKSSCDQLVDNIDLLLEKYKFQDAKYAGRSVGMGYYVNQMINETLFFIGLSFILVMIFLVFTFRSVWGLWVPLTIVGASMVWIVGFMGLVNEPINLILTTLPSIIFVVAMSDVMHLVSKYLDELRLGKSKKDAILSAYKEVGKATLLTSLTTAVGFLTLLMVDMQPVQAFGTYTAIGVVLAFILAYTLLPSLLVLTKMPKISGKQYNQTFWYKILHPSFLWLLKYKKRLLIGFTILFGVSIYGSTLVINDYFLLEDLKKDNELRQTYQYFNDQFAGLRPFEMSIKVKDDDKSIFDYEVLQEIDKMQNYLEENYQVDNAFSIVSMLKVANRTNHGGQKKYYKFPTEEEADKYIEQFKKFDRSGALSVIVDSTEHYGRISSSIGDVGMIKITEMNKALKGFIDSEIDTDLVEFKITGTGHLLDINMSRLSSSLFSGLALAVGIVSLLMGFLFRSFKMVIIAMIPNILPMLMLGALLGFAGIELKVSTALVFTISFGIAVDDTIHFMSKLKIELDKGKPMMLALRRSFLSTGRAIVLTTIILIAGFLMLMFSDFLGTFFIGLLISCVLIFALIADLFFLPVLLIYFFKPRKKKQKELTTNN